MKPEIARLSPAITGKSEAMDEIFKEGKDCIMCEMADPESIADSILKLKNDDYVYQFYVLK